MHLYSYCDTEMSDFHQSISGNLGGNLDGLTLLKTKSSGHAAMRGPDSSQTIYCKQSRG